MADKRQKATKVKCKRKESLTKQSMFVEYSLLSKDKAFEFCWCLLADEHNSSPKLTRRHIKLDKFIFGTPWLPDLLYKHWFASSVRNFCCWVADIPPRETSLAAKSEEKRMFFACYKLFCVAIGFEIGTAKNKSSKWPEQDSNPGLLDCESDVLTNSHTASQVSLVLLSCSALIAHINLTLLSGHIICRNVTKVQQGPGIFTGYYKQDRVSLIWGTADRGTAEPLNLWNLQNLKKWLFYYNCL